MTESLHPAASHHLPSFITGPGESDWLMTVTALFLLASVVGFGIVFLRLHTLPERVAHKSKKVQFEIVAILGLIALFTHMHIFWVAGLLLAFIDLPDLGGFLGRIAGSVEKMAGIKPGTGADEAAAVDEAKSVAHTAAHHDAADAPSEKSPQARKADGLTPARARANSAGPGQTEATHA